jgi:hypothetical protein
LQVPTQASQMKTFGPAIRRLTLSSGLPQNEQTSLRLMVGLLDPVLADLEPQASTQIRDTI